MKLALECPTAILDMVQPFGDIDWVIAPYVLKDKEYTEFYRQSKRLKVLNNTDGVAEPLGIDDFKKAFDAIGGNAVIIPPDEANDRDKTLVAYSEYCKEFGDASVVSVLQGDSFKNALSCLAYYKGEVAVPYNLGSDSSAPNWLMGLRRALVVSNIPADRPIHLLGFNTVEELEWYEGRANVVSINTGYPVLLGLEEADILDTERMLGKPEATFPKMAKLCPDEKKLNQTKYTATIRNIALLRRYLG